MKEVPALAAQPRLRLPCTPLHATIEELGARQPRPAGYWQDDIIALAETLVMARQGAST